MKKKFVIGITSFFISLFLFLSCEGIAEEEEISLQDATVSESWDYQESSPVAEITSDVLEVRLNGLKAGQKVYLAKINPTSDVFEKDLVRYVDTATGVKLTTTKRDSGSARSALAIEESSLGEDSDLPEIVDIVVEPEFDNSRAAVAATPLEASERAELKVGAKTQLYISHGTKSGNLSSFYKEDATLYAVGEHCNVWIVDRYYGSSNFKVNKSRAENFADQFDRNEQNIYESVRDVFGEESDRIFISKSELGDMETYSRFGKKVNIVIYDIGNDSANGGIVGYFSTKDYYLAGVTKYSNSGKFLYIDSYFANNYLGLSVSTLAHEFQHLIHFGMKKIRHNLSSATWYNEMLSMLAEDYVHKKLGINDGGNLSRRLSRFVKSYFDVGLEYRTDKVLESYASAYAFGAWLVREYGGEELLRELSQNAAVNLASVVQAVSVVNGKKTSIGSLLGEYTQACVFNKELVYDYPTFNQQAGYFYPIKLWPDNEGPPDSVRGPILYGYNDQYELRPYGINLVEIGTVDSPGGVLIRFNETGAANQKLYVFIQ